MKTENGGVSLETGGCHTSSRRRLLSELFFKLQVRHIVSLLSMSTDSTEESTLDDWHVAKNIRSHVPLYSVTSVTKC